MKAGTTAVFVNREKDLFTHDPEQKRIFSFHNHSLTPGQKYKVLDSGEEYSLCDRFESPRTVVKIKSDQGVDIWCSAACFKEFKRNLPDWF